MTTAIITREPIKVIGDILVHELDLAEGQVMLGLEKFDINKAPDLFIALQYVDSKVIGAKSEINAAGDEVQSASALDLVQLDIMSFDAQARTRRFEVIMAFRSVYSRRLQSENGISIARLPMAFIPAPSLEETKWLNRFVIRFFVNSVYAKTVEDADFFDTPNLQLNVDQINQ